MDARRGELFGKVEAFIDDRLVGWVQFSEAEIKNDVSNTDYWKPIENEFGGITEWEQVGDIPREIWIKYVYVEPEYRRKGIGTAMYEKIKQEFPGEKIVSSGTTDEGGEFRHALTERGVLASIDPKFQRWFAGSKVVDAHGKPLKAYHETRYVFDKFRPGALGIYFTADPDAANEYVHMRPEQVEETAKDLEENPELREEYNEDVMNSHVRPVYLAIKNPLTITPSELMHEQTPEFKWLSTDAVKSKGYDGIRVVADPSFDDILFKEDTWIAFNNNQVWSATANKVSSNERLKPIVENNIRKYVCPCGNVDLDDKGHTLGPFYECDKNGKEIPEDEISHYIACGKCMRVFDTADKLKVVRQGVQHSMFNSLPEEKPKIAGLEPSEKWEHIKRDFYAGIVYHGTTAGIAEEIMKNGFRGLNYDQILEDVLNLYGKKWEDISPLYQKNIRDNKKSYSHEFDTVSTTPAGEVAVRFAGGGEIPRQVEHFILESDKHVSPEPSRITWEPAIVMCRIKTSKTPTSTNGSIN